MNERRAPPSTTTTTAGTLRIGSRRAIQRHRELRSKDAGSETLRRSNMRADVAARAVSVGETGRRSNEEVKKKKGGPSRPSLRSHPPLPWDLVDRPYVGCGRACQRRADFNANARARRAEPRRTPSAARALLRLPQARLRAAHRVPTGDTPARKTGELGTQNETPVQSRAVRLLERAPRRAAGAGARRHRAGRDPPGAGRHLRARGRPASTATCSASPAPGSARCSAAS